MDTEPTVLQGVGAALPSWLLTCGPTDRALPGQMLPFRRGCEWALRRELAAMLGCWLPSQFMRHVGESLARVLVRGRGCTSGSPGLALLFRRDGRRDGGRLPKLGRGPCALVWMIYPHLGPTAPVITGSYRSLAPKEPPSLPSEGYGFYAQQYRPPVQGISVRAAATRQ